MRWICKFMILGLVVLSGITNLWGMEEEERASPHSVLSSASSDDSELDIEDSHLFSVFFPAHGERSFDEECSLSPFGVSSSPESEEDSGEPITLNDRQISDPIDIPYCNKETTCQREYPILTSEEEKLLSCHLQCIPDGDPDDRLTYENLIGVSVRELCTIQERMELIRHANWLITGRNKLSDGIDAVSGLLAVLPSVRKVFFHQLVLLASWLPQGQVIPGWIIYKTAQLDSNLQSLFFRRLTLWLDKVDNLNLFNISPHLDEQDRFSGLNMALFFVQKWFEREGADFPKDWVISSLEKNLSLWKRAYKGLVALIPSFRRTVSERDFEAALMLLSVSPNPALVATLAQDAANQLEEKLDFQLLSFLAILSKVPDDHANHQFILLEILKNTPQSSDGLYILNAFQNYVLQECDGSDFIGILKEVHRKLYKIEDPDQRFKHIKQILLTKMPNSIDA